MNVLSLFDGLSCGQIALTRNGTGYDNYFASEIDKYAINVTQKNYPGTIQLGDVQFVTGQQFDAVGGIDLLIGGSPCTGFSFAGKQQNFKDPKSKLFFEYVRLRDECKPKYFLFENVKMKKEYEQVITEHLGFEPIEINSALVSAQNRRRLYWTNITGITQPEDKNIYWGDVREHGVEWGPMYYSNKAMDWLGKHGTEKGKKLKVHADDEKMQMLEASHYKKYSAQRFFGIIDKPVQCGGAEDIVISQKPESRYPDVYRTLEQGEYYRYVTPLECERLQTVPDGYTNLTGVSNTQRYKMIGNGWTVDVITHILSFMN